MTLTDVSDVRPDSVLLADGAESCLSTHTTKHQAVVARVVSQRIVRGAIGSLTGGLGYARRFPTINFFKQTIRSSYCFAAWFSYKNEALDSFTVHTAVSLTNTRGFDDVRPLQLSINVLASNVDFRFTTIKPKTCRCTVEQTRSQINTLLHIRIDN